ncbi:MAG: porin [Rhodocyclaceae bacterium]|nr:MAG: porin [Rhodocyclaceae bacterium]TND02568.1 MAG: porin [Rhodocyclaceae bacterium]
MIKQFTFRKRMAATLVASACGFCLAPSVSMAAEADIAKLLDSLEKELATLKAQAAKPAPESATAGGKAVALSSTDGITIYGRVDLVVENSNDGKVARNVLQNISSRIGFKGERKLTDGLTGLMQIETGVAPDDSAQSKTFASRNSFVGLRSQSLGSLIAGTHDMPFKKLEGTASPMWGSAEAMEILLHGKGTARVVATMNDLHTRQKNVVQYWSPKFSNIEVKLAYAPDEVNGAAGTQRKPVYGASVEFDNKMWNVGLATETQKKFTATNGDMTGLKATAGMKRGAATFGVGYSKLDNNSGKKTNNWLIAGSYEFGPTILKANCGKSSESSSGAQDGLKMFGVELDYPLDKYTTLYGYYTTITNEANARGRFEAGDNKYSPVAGDDPRALGIGVRYNF